MNNIFKSVLVNLFCALPAAAAGSVIFEAVSFKAAFIFTLVILWLCNEAWYWVLTIPAIIATILSAATKKPLHERLQTKLVRLTSLSLLVVPHLLFTILYVLNKLTQGQVGEEIGIPPGQSYFVTAFVAVALLWVFNLIMSLLPLSVGALLSYFLEPEDCTEHTTPSELPSVPAAPAAPAEQLPDGLLYCGKPVLGVSPAHVRGSFRTGLFMLPFVLLALGMAAGLLEHSLFAACICGGVALVFAFCAIRLLRWPSLWRKRMEGVSYAFSRDEVIITEKGGQRRFALNEGLNLSHEKLEGTVGNIYIAPTDKIGRALKGFLGKMKVEVTDAGNHADIHAPLMGFFQIDNSMEVFRLLVSCRDNKPGAQD